jgi:hypothetical protein
VQIFFVPFVQKFLKKEACEDIPLKEGDRDEVYEEISAKGRGP